MCSRFEKTKVFVPIHFQTALCSTAIDNPTGITKQDMVYHILYYLPTDTVLFQSGVSFSTNSRSKCICDLMDDLAHSIAGKR